jgi:hypothetical protein
MKAFFLSWAIFTIVLAGCSSPQATSITPPANPFYVIVAEDIDWKVPARLSWFTCDFHIPPADTRQYWKIATEFIYVLWKLPRKEIKDCIYGRTIQGDRSIILAAPWQSAG